MNPQVRNTWKTSKLKININLENVHFISLYCIIMLQCIVQKTRVLITNVATVLVVTVAISSSRDNNTENMLELLLSLNIS